MISLWIVLQACIIAIFPKRNRASIVITLISFGWEKNISDETKNITLNRLYEWKKKEQMKKWRKQIKKRLLWVEYFFSLILLCSLYVIFHLMVRYQRPFSRLRKRTQKQIVYVLIKKASYSALCAAVLFSLLAYMYREIIFLIVWICFFVLFWFFRFYQIIRRRELARYYTIEYLQKIDPYDFWMLCDRTSQSYWL